MQVASSSCVDESPGVGSIFAQRTRLTLVGALGLFICLGIVLPGRSNAQSGTFTFSETSYTAAVSQTNAIISVVLSGGPPILVTVSFATHDGTATAGVDYVSVSGILVFDVGITSNAFPVPLLNNGIPHSTRTVNLTLSDPSPTATLGSPSNAVLIITNTLQQAVQFAQPTFTVNQGESNAVVTIVRTGIPTGEGTVFFETSDGSARAGIDYTATSGTLTFANGVETNTVSIPILSTSSLITNQTVNLRLSDPSGIVLGSQSNAVLTIVATGPTVLEFSSPTYNFLQNVGGATLDVIRFGSSAATATVDFATSDGTAVDGVDYVGTSGTLIFPAGIAAGTISFPFVEFNTFQSNKTVFVTLSNPVGGTLGTQDTAVVTIVNDKPQTVTFTNDDGAVVTLRLAHGGTMDVPPGSVPSNIVFSATDTGSVFRVSVKKGTNGTSIVQIGGLSGDGDLRRIEARNVDLIGNGVQINGFVRDLRVHDILNGASISVAGDATDQMIFAAHIIDDGAVIATDCRIVTFNAARIGDVAITAPSIRSLLIRGDKRNGIAGDFNGQIELSGDGVLPGVATLSKFRASGEMSNASINVLDGNLDSVIASAIIDSSVYVGFTPADPTDPLSGGTFIPDSRLGNVSTKSTSDGFVNSVLVAPVVGKIRLSSIETDNGGIEFGVRGNQSISSVTSKDPPFTWDRNGDPDQSLDDFHVILP
jgi:hypothetical protein